jgi:hypothetical protein
MVVDTGMGVLLTASSWAFVVCVLELELCRLVKLIWHFESGSLL